MEEQILLNSNKSKSTFDSDVSLRFNLSNNKDTLPDMGLNETLNYYNQYLVEREKCNKIRLTAQINVLATNVLCNYVSEVVKDEDSNDCVCLNFNPKTFEKSEIIGNKPQAWGGDNIYELCKDTQLSRPIPEMNYTYHPGIDILNNHVLRSKTPISSFYLNLDVNNTNVFNTIEDYIKDKNGYKQLSVAHKKLSRFSDEFLHIYNKSNFLPFSHTLKNCVQDNGGWIGFVNKSKMPVMDDDGKDLNLSRVLNNRKVGEFIEFYPSSKDYQFTPYYNSKRKRIENNWEHALLYPSSSTTANIPSINQKLDTLKIIFIDENTVDYDALDKTIIYSMSKHGLQPGDSVNIYRSSSDNSRHELAEGPVEVESVIDEFTFAVYLSEPLCKEWINILDVDAIESVFDEIDYETMTFTCDDKTVYAHNDYINADFDTENEIGSQNLSFAKVSNNIQNQYYARIFSRYPNLEFMEDEKSEENLYAKKNGTRVIDELSTMENQHTSTVSRLSFAKNVYGDNMAQIVYNDDISLDYVHDNLGRPITSLYLSFIKTNYGYKEWYSGDTGNKKVEHSHCFGKLNCGLELSPYMNANTPNLSNIYTMNNIDEGFGGITQLPLRSHVDGVDDDEIIVSQTSFYGDIVEYNTFDCIETPVQSFMYRFNTAQRELNNDAVFGVVRFDEISCDDFDSEAPFAIETHILEHNPTQKREGYYYQPHFEIPIRSFAPTTTVYTPQQLEIAYLSYDASTMTMTISTTKENYIDLSSDIYIYNKETRQSYHCQVSEVLSLNSVKLKLLESDKSSDFVNLKTSQLSNYSVYRRTVGIPSYAIFENNGMLSFRWRNIYQNGLEEFESAMPQYPYVNDSLYVHANIVLALRRQDPDATYGLSDTNGISVLEGKVSDNEFGNDDAVIEKDALC